MKKILYCLAGFITAAILTSMRPSLPVHANKKDTLSRAMAYTIIPAGEETNYYVKGNLAFSSRRITDTDLPLKVMQKLMRRFPDNYIRRIMRFYAKGYSMYFITLESKTDFNILCVNHFNHVSVFKHLKKQDS